MDKDNEEALQEFNISRTMLKKLIAYLSIDEQIPLCTNLLIVNNQYDYLKHLIIPFVEL